MIMLKRTRTTTPSINKGRKYDVSKRRPRGKGKRPRVDSMLWREAFLTAFRNSGNVRVACLQANVRRATVYDWRDRDKGFADEWDTAKDEALDLLAAEARRRALTKSDILLIYMLKCQGGPEWRQDQKVPLVGDKEGQLTFTLRFEKANDSNSDKAA